MSIRLTFASNTQPDIEPAESLPPLWMYKEDREVFGYIRPCAPCPAVMTIKEDPHAFMSQQYQYYLRAINYNMDLFAARRLLNYKLAFANYTGFDDPDDQRADYFLNRNLTLKLPNLDKVRTCSRAVVTGEPGYSLLQAIVQTFYAVRSRGLRRSVMAETLTSQNILKVKLFDSQLPPPLKPNRNIPQDIREVNPDDYEIMPRTHPWMFATANIVNKAGEVVPFPLGGLYSWTEDNTPRSFIPHMANFRYGPFQIPLTKLQPVSTVPSPYRRID